MSIYTQQISSIVEQLPITEQEFILELVKKISLSNNIPNANELNLKLIKQNQKETVRKIIKNLNNAEPLLDDPLDEILTKGISVRNVEELDVL